MKVFALVSSDAYRSHSDQLFCYDDGAWVRTDSIAATTPEWLLKVLRVCQAYFLLVAHLKTPRTNRGVLAELQLLKSPCERRVDRAGVPVRHEPGDSTEKSRALVLQL